jgi:hypothetical protein
MSGNRNSGLNWALWLGGGYLGYKYILKPMLVEPSRLKTYTQRVRVTMPAVRFQRGGDEVEFDVYVQNPNTYAMTVQAIVGDVFISYSGKPPLKLGNVFRYGNVVIKPLGETKYTFRVRLKLIPLVQYFNDILAGKVRNQVLAFRGYATIDGRPWPIKESVPLTLK